MRVKPPKKNAENIELISWIRSHNASTILTTKEKDQILKEIADKMFSSHPFNGKRLRFILLNQRQDLWEKENKKSPFVFRKEYQSSWSFNRISKTLLREYIRFAFYFNEAPKGKQYQTFQVALSPEWIDKIKKMQGDKSLLAFMNELVDEFSSLPLSVRNQLIDEAKKITD